MCHGHPRFHSCAHTSLIWYYCPSAFIDLKTGYEEPCSKVSFSPSQRSNLPCPLRNCQFSDKGGSWMCCKCNQGPNTQGWCANPMASVNEGSTSLAPQDQRTCDHGCCEKCTKVGRSRSPSPDRRFHEASKGGSSSRKFGKKSSSRPSHQCESPFARLSLSKGQEHSSAAMASSSSGSGAYKDSDHRSKKSKQSKKNQKSKNRG